MLGLFNRNTGPVEPLNVRPWHPPSAVRNGRKQAARIVANAQRAIIAIPANVERGEQAPDMLPALIDNRGVIMVEVSAQTDVEKLNNRFHTPADGWYQLVPKGEFLHKPTGLMQVIDDDAIKAMDAKFKAQKTKEGKDFRGVRGDYDHLSQDEKQKSEATGWVADTQARPDGLYGRIAWSDEGEKAVKGGRYRYLSPVWNKSDLQYVGENRVRPLVLDQFGLTNDPNIRELKPLSTL